eukprot:SAG11_NODE_674_length_7801_cov_3.578032_6_plen_128_part_00
MRRQRLSGYTNCVINLPAKSRHCPQILCDGNIASIDKVAKIVDAALSREQRVIYEGAKILWKVISVVADRACVTGAGCVGKVITNVVEGEVETIAVLIGVCEHSSEQHRTHNSAACLHPCFKASCSR